MYSSGVVYIEMLLCLVCHGALVPTYRCNGLILAFLEIATLCVTLQFLQDVEGELQVVCMEEASIMRRISADTDMRHCQTLATSNGHSATGSSSNELGERLLLVKKSRQNLGKYKPVVIIAPCFSNARQHENV